MQNFGDTEFLGGLITGNQLIAALIAAIIFAIVYRTFKTRVAKTLVVVVILVMLGLYLYHSKPAMIDTQKAKQLTSIENDSSGSTKKKIEDAATKEAVKAINKSKKYVTFKNGSMQIRVTDYKTNKKHWVDIKEIKAIRTNPKDGSMYITVASGNHYQVLDSNVRSIMRAISK